MNTENNKTGWENQFFFLFLHPHFYNMTYR